MTCTLVYEDPGSDPNVTTVNALDSLTKCIAEGTLAAFCALLSLNNAVQSVVSALAQMAIQVAKEEEAITAEAKDKLNDFITQNIKPLEDVPSDEQKRTENQNKLTEENYQYTLLKTDYDTKEQSAQTELQRQVQLQGSIQDSTKVVVQVAQDVPDLNSYVASLLR